MTIDSPALPRLPQRSLESHKGDYGRALLVGGSRGMSGAISLAGMSALRSGAGLVTLAVPDVCLDTVASFEPSYMTEPLPGDDAGRISAAAREKIAKLVASATCVACGPGCGRSTDLTELIAWMYESIFAPMVFDADALFALAEQPERLSNHAGPRILTPHPGEFRRLVGNAPSTRDNLEVQAIEFAKSNDVVLVLKGHRTLVADAVRQVHNSTGNPGMATGGSGDVLTGIITAMVCQGLGAFEAAQLGVYVHGLAGDLAAEQFSQVSLIATDLIDFLSLAIQKSHV